MGRFVQMPGPQFTQIACGSGIDEHGAPSHTVYGLTSAGAVWFWDAESGEFVPAGLPTPVGVVPVEPVPVVVPVVPPATGVPPAKEKERP